MGIIETWSMLDEPGSKAKHKEQVETKWTPANFDKRCNKINKKKVDNGQTKVSIDTFQRHWWSENPGTWLDERKNWSYPIKSGSLRCYLHLMTPCRKTKTSLDSFQRYWWSKNPAI